jgi:hypothetical protein
MTLDRAKAGSRGRTADGCRGPKLVLVACLLTFPVSTALAVQVSVQKQAPDIVPPASTIPPDRIVEVIIDARQRTAQNPGSPDGSPGMPQEPPKHSTAPCGSILTSPVPGMKRA